jgi:hypothetical protein
MMLLKCTSTCTMPADLGRGRDLHLDVHVNSNKIPEDGPIEPKHIGYKTNWFISVFTCALCRFSIVRTY